jgi:TRAP-type C4-dicarboxylate transport system permease small subunit
MGGWRIVHALADLVKIIGAGCLTGMMLLTCLDVVCRRFFNAPIFGAVEIVGFMATLVTAFALAYTHREKGHIGVDLVMQRLSGRTQRLVDVVTTFLSLALFVLLAWQMVEYAGTMQASGEVSISLQLPEYLVIYAVSAGVIILVLVLLHEFIELLKGKAR